MSILKSLFKSNKSANTAKERLKIVIHHERENSKLQNNVSFIPKLQDDILEVLKKYIDNVDKDRVDIKIDQQQTEATLELNVTFPSTSC